MPNEDNRIYLEFPASEVKIELGETITFDNVSGFLNSGRVLYNDVSLTDELAHLENDKADADSVYSKTEIDNALDLKADKADTYTKTEIDSSLELKADKSNTYTKSEVDTLIDNLPEAMVFKGTLGVGGTIQALPTASTSNEGWTYKVITDGTYSGQDAKSGDVFVSNGSAWVLIPSGDEDNDTWRAIKVNGTEKLGNAISSGSVDFVDSSDIKVTFETNGNKIKLTLVSPIPTKTSELENDSDFASIDDTQTANDKTWSSEKIVSSVPIVTNYYNKDEIDAFLEDKADVDGTYNDMTVGNAKQLKSNVGENDKVPYNFRTSGGSIDIGESETDMLVGGTVAFNQLAKPISNDNYNNTASTVSYSDGVATITSTGDYSRIFLKAANNPIITANHVYLVTCNYKTNYEHQVNPINMNVGGVYKNRAITPTPNVWATHYEIIKATSNAFNYMYFGDISNRYESGNITDVKNIQFIDLTALFGTTIANYIYTLESGTTGAGVAWFKSLFPKPYYAYNSGELISVKTSAHKTVGFNAWNEEWEVGAFNNSTGEKKSAPNYWRSKNRIKVLPNTLYYAFTSGDNVYRFYYDASGNYIGTESGVINSIFTTPNNAYYLNIVDVTRNAYDKSSKPVCINLSWDGERNGEYEPYEEHVYALDSDLELRGIPKLDANNKLYYDGDTYESDGTVTRKYEYRAYASGDESLPDTITDGTHTVTKLVTPTTETADEFTNPQIVNNFGTEEYVDTRAVPIPVGHDTFYPTNLRAKLEMAPDSPSGDGDYIVRQINGKNEYVALPTLPTTNGTYTLKCTVSGGTPTLSWVAGS